MSKKVLLTSLGLYIISALISFTTFSFFSSKSTTDSANLAGDDQTALGSLLNIDPSEPRDQVCPLNGKLFTQTEKTAWEKRRPLAVMIENSPDARPQSGLTDADIVFEAMAEGGVTRFMALYYCGAQANEITLAPIRSARTYFIDWASGFNYPLYTHVGGANLPGPTNALGQIEDYGWGQQNDLNQFSIGYPTFVRNENRLGKEVATEHTMETSTEKLWTVAEERGWTNIAPERRLGRLNVGGDDWKDGFTPWTFADGQAAAAPTVTSVSFEFWDGFADYGVQWNYDSATNTYKRVLAGEPHVDLNNNEQIAAANAIILKTVEDGPMNELKHMLYETVGTGEALIFNNGTVTEANWSKKSREAELTFTDAKGAPLALNRGLTWISVVDVSTEVTY